jgi:uncharacterized protein
MKKLISTLALAAAAAIAYAIPASAHVTAQPPEQPSGGYTVVSFRVPSERPEATNKLEVQFPDGISSVRTAPVVGGWKVDVKMEKLDTPIDDGHGGKLDEQVDTVTWSGGEIKDGEFQEFPVSIKMVDKGELGDMVFFPAIQTYEGGEVANWTEKPSSADDDAELEKPAPSVTLVAADGGHDAMDMSDDMADEKADEKADDSDSSDAVSASDVSDAEDSARIALGIGILALVIGAFALFRAMRSKR